MASTRCSRGNLPRGPSQGSVAGNTRAATADVTIDETQFQVLLQAVRPPAPPQPAPQVAQAAQAQ